MSSKPDSFIRIWSALVVGIPGERSSPRLVAEGAFPPPADRRLNVKTVKQKRGFALSFNHFINQRISFD
jgi:hypothetical protein